MKKRRIILLVALGVILLLTFVGCSSAGAGGGESNDDATNDEETTDDGTDEGEETGTTVAAPENLVGTFALSNGSSAVMDLQVGGTSSSALFASATLQVTGNVRYQGADYIVGGLYDDSDGSLDLIAENEGTGNRFVFSGSYTVSDGFSGTVTLLDSGGNELATGTASATGVSDADKGGLRVFVGTFGGDDWGSWNGTLTSDRFYGTYFSEKYNEGGSFSMTRSGSTVGLTDQDGLTASGEVNGAEDAISGSWDSVWQWQEETVNESGSWGGRLVDSNADAPAIDDTLDQEYLANLLNQTWENMVARVEAELDTDDDGDYLDNLVDGENTTTAVAGVSARYTYDAGVVTYYRYEFTGGGYTDPRTGITLSGGGTHIQITGESTVVLAMDAGLTEATDTTTGNADTTDGSTLSVAYDGGGTNTLQIDVTIDYAAETLSGAWLFAGTDYVTSMGYLFF